MTRDTSKPHDPFGEHEREQRRRWAALSHRERLAWLWQAKLFTARAAGRARKGGDLGG